MSERRVLHMMSSLQPSGMEMMLLSGYAEWLRWGYRCDVVATGRDLGPMAERMREAGYGVFHAPFRGRHKYLPRAGFVADFMRLCASGYDVLHIHTEEAAPLFVVLARLAGVRRIVLSPHNTFRFDGLLRMRKYLERRFIRALGGRFGMISDGVQRCEWERYRNPGVRTWNWLDTARFRPPTPTERNEARRIANCRVAFVIVSVGNCNEVKNHRAILEAIPLLPEPEQVLYLHLGREQDGEPERKLAAELGIANTVRFLGMQADPLPCLWAADAFVMPSLREGLPIAAIEAIACGVPAVFSDVEGLRDIIAETTWTVVTSTEAEAVATGIADVMSTPEQVRRERALADSALVRERFSIANGVRSMVDLYRGVALGGVLKERP
jgi:glycosyltransferase involved in cell wall biosynthesis